MFSFQFKQKYRIQVHIDLAQQKYNLDTTLILLPAIGVPICKYQLFIQQLNQAGYTIISADYPCCGENTPHIDQNHDYNYQDLIEDFIPQLIQFSSTSHHFLLGHSLGGHLATIYSQIHAIPSITVASGNIHYQNWQGLGKLRLLNAVALFKFIMWRYGYFAGYKVGFGHREAKSLMQNWCHTVLTGNYHFIQIPFTQKHRCGLLINIENDDFSPYLSTQKLSEYYDQVTLKQVRLPAHLKGNPHSVWLKQPDVIVETIVDYHSHL